jgi:hypothetical protein
MAINLRPTLEVTCKILARCLTTHDPKNRSKSTKSTKDTE